LAIEVEYLLLIYTVFVVPICTTQRTRNVSVREGNRWVLCREIPVYR